MTFSALEDMAKLVNMCPPTSKVKVPETKYKIMKKFREDCEIEFDFHVFCERCKTCTMEKSDEWDKTKCTRCQKVMKPAEENFFVHIHIEHQLRGIIKKYWPEIVAYMNTRHKNDHIRDIRDGKLIKALDDRNQGAYNLSLLMNTDGASAFDSNQKSLWPIQFYLNFLPPSLRFYTSNIIVGALYFADGKPNVSSFFEPLAKEIADLQETLLAVEIDGTEWKFNISLTHASLDLPAKSSVLNCNQYNGDKGCSYCLHPGEMTTNQNNPRKTMKYPWNGVAYAARNHLDTLRAMEKVENSANLKVNYYI